MSQSIRRYLYRVLCRQQIGINALVTRDIRGRSNGWYMGIYTPKIRLLWGKMTSERLLKMSIKFYTSPKNIPPKQISG